MNFLAGQGYQSDWRFQFERNGNHKFAYDRGTVSTFMMANSKCHNWSSGLKISSGFIVAHSMSII